MYSYQTRQVYHGPEDKLGPLRGGTPTCMRALPKGVHHQVLLVVAGEETQVAVGRVGGAVAAADGRQRGPRRTLALALQEEKAQHGKLPNMQLGNKEIRFICSLHVRSSKLKPHIGQLIFFSFFRDSTLCLMF